MKEIARVQNAKFVKSKVSLSKVLSCYYNKGLPKKVAAQLSGCSR